ncbi:MAG: glycoside hydrolase family 3 C-terminal domain-containing protein [Parasporobacterium sp.]|nr:glycoside hydrolase family 3 C-terminal domain-containing protein [Parasporobacterium sp.]
MNKTTCKRFVKKGLPVLLGCSMAMSTIVPSMAADGRFYSTYSNLEEVRAGSEEINLQIAQESIVLMKNKDNVLPLKNVKAVSVFGKAAEDPFYAGGGSGTAEGYYPDEMYTSVYQSLEDAGYSVNPALKAFYEKAASVTPLGSNVSTGGDDSGESSGESSGDSSGGSGAESAEDSGESSGESSGGGTSSVSAPSLETSGNLASISEVDPADFTGSVLESYDRYSDAAIVVLGRTGSEGGDKDMGKTREAYITAHLNQLEASGASQAEIDERRELLEYKLDNDPKFAADALRHGLMLTYEEEQLIKHVTENFDTVIVVLNSPEQIELGWVEDGSLGDIDACLWVGHPGLNGFEALGQVLNGSVNPSGRLVDIWQADMTKDPTYQNMMENVQNENGTSDYVYTDEEGEHLIHAVEYEEGIYYGYRYYETAAVEGFIDYDEAVVYPFGYGLSYTEFTKTMDSVERLTDEAGNAYYNINVTVANTGDTAGKEVVEVYYTAPYISGGIEKAHVVLGAFDKTELLQPGECQTLTLTIYEQDMASYDYDDANANGHTGYELDGGKYIIKLMENSHDVIAEQEVEIEAQNFDTDRITGATVENLFSDTVDPTYNSTYTVYDENGNAMYDGKGGLTHTMVTMSRADFAGTFPTAPVVTIGENGKVGSEGTVVLDMSQEAYEDMKITFVPGSTEDESDQKWYDYYMDYFTSENAEGQTWDQGVIGENVINLQDMTGKSWDDPDWITFLNQMSWEQLSNFLCYSGYWSISLSDDMARRKNQSLESNGVELVDGQNLGVPFTEQADGPVAIKRQNTGSGGLDDVGIQWTSTMNIAATWNTELARIRGVMVGEEALALELDGWYGVAMNIHRSPWGGRNFEYFSEDPLLSGKISAAEVIGIQSKGVNAFIKHYAVNHQDTDRGPALPGMVLPGQSDFGLVTFVDEQTIREVYTKSFQIAVEEGGAMGLMNSMNHIGLRSNSNNFNLMTALLRGEWGFMGYTVTDIVPAGQGNSYADSETLTRIGADLPLNANAGIKVSGDWNAETKCVEVNGERNDIAWAAVRMSVKRAMYVNANSSVMRNNLNMDAFGAESELKGTIGVAISASAAVDEAELGTTDTAYVLEGTLPSGVTFDKYKGTFNGTPMESGTFTFTVKITADGGWISESKEFTLTVVDNLFDYSGLKGTAGSEFNGKVESEILTDEGAAVTFRAEGLPSGLTMSEDGSITGIPAEAGTYDVTIYADSEKESTGGFNNPFFNGSSTTVENYILHVTVTVE